MTDSIHVRGTVLPEGRERDIFIRDGTISFESSDGDARTILDHGYVIPGLVDMHSHLPFNSPAEEGADWETAARASAELELRAGVLAVRDPGGPTPHGFGPSTGLPRTFTAGRFLAAANHMFPEHGQIEVDDDELPEAAEEQVRSSGGWVKVIGDFPIPNVGFEAAFKADTLAEVARRVHALGGRVAIHAIAAETVAAAVEAGFDSIEHGLMIQPAQISDMADRGLALTPTMISTPVWLPGVLQQMGIPSAEIERTVKAIDAHASTVRLAYESGVTILAGTDAGVVAHGLVHDEIRLLNEAGIPIEHALGAGSWVGRAFLGLPAIEEGAPADLVAFERNPLEDPSSLSDPLLIILDGTVVKAPST